MAASKQYMHNIYEHLRSCMRLICFLLDLDVMEGSALERVLIMLAQKHRYTA